MPDFQRAPIADAPLSVILFPGGAADVEEVLAGWEEYLAGLARPYELIVVREGGTDAGARLERLAGENQRLRLVTLDSEGGIGAALRAGFQAAQHPLVVTAPCDKQYHPPDLQRALGAIEQVDLVAGYRVGSLPRCLRLWDWFRRALARVMLGAGVERRDSWSGWEGWRRRWLARWIFGVRVLDPECPFRLYRRQVVERLVIQSDSSVAQVEILAKANHLASVMAEVPVSWIAPKTTLHGLSEKLSGVELRRLFFDPKF